MIILREYIKNLLIEMIGKEPDYKIKEIALDWYAKSELTLEDLDEITALIDEKNSKEIENSFSVEEIPEENTEISEEIIEEPTVDEILSENTEEPLILE